MLSSSAAQSVGSQAKAQIPSTKPQGCLAVTAAGLTLVASTKANSSQESMLQALHAALHQNSLSGKLPLHPDFPSTFISEKLILLSLRRRLKCWKRF